MAETNVTPRHEGARAADKVVRSLPTILQQESGALTSVYHAKKDAAIMAFLTAAGCVSERAEGVIRSLAEHVVNLEQDAGYGDLENWESEAALSDEERIARRRKFAEECDAD